MPPRTKPGELPKPIIRPGTLGCLPLNPFTLAYLQAGQADLLLGYRDTPETESFKQRPGISIQIGAKHQTLSLAGKFFNGHSEALYRGLLPEVLLVAAEETHLKDFLRDFTEYLHKIVNMGFFYPKKTLARHNPVDELIPCTILTGNGLLFSQFITQLSKELDRMAQEQPILDHHIRSQILGRFVRGIPDLEENHSEVWLEPDALDVPVGRVILLPKVPTTIRIAGGSPHTQKTIQTVLASHGLTGCLETHSRNAVERLEFENILWRLSSVIMPALLTTNEELKRMTLQATTGIVSMGRHRQAFDSHEKPEQLLSRFGQKPAKTAKKTAKTQTGTQNVNPTLQASDAELLHDLEEYAASLGMNDERQLYADLAQRIVTQQSNNA